MKAGMVLGIIGGVIALLIGGVGYGLTSVGGSLASAVDDADGQQMMQLYGFASIALPVVALVGSGLTMKNPSLAAILMAGSAVGMLLVFGFGTLSLIPTALLGIGAALVFMDTQKDTAATR